MERRWIREGQRALCGDPSFSFSAPSENWSIASERAEPNTHTTDDGLFADNGQEFIRFHAISAGSRWFFNQADSAWSTTIDYG